MEIVPGGPGKIALTSTTIRVANLQRVSSVWYTQRYIPLTRTLACAFII